VKKKKADSHGHGGHGHGHHGHHRLLKAKAWEPIFNKLNTLQTEFHIAAERQVTLKRQHKWAICIFDKSDKHCSKPMTIDLRTKKLKRQSVE
jgi:hypothetical protein